MNNDQRDEKKMEQMRGSHMLFVGESTHGG